MTNGGKWDAEAIGGRLEGRAESSPGMCIESSGLSCRYVELSYRFSIQTIKHNGVDLYMFTIKGLQIIGLRMFVYKDISVRMDSSFLHSFEHTTIGVSWDVSQVYPAACFWKFGWWFYSLKGCRCFRCKCLHVGVPVCHLQARVPFLFAYVRCDHCSCMTGFWRRICITVVAFIPMHSRFQL